MIIFIFKEQILNYLTHIRKRIEKWNIIICECVNQYFLDADITRDESFFISANLLYYVQIVLTRQRLDFTRQLC